MRGLLSLQSDEIRRQALERREDASPLDRERCNVVADDAKSSACHVTVSPFPLRSHQHTLVLVDKVVQAQVRGELPKSQIIN